NFLRCREPNRKRIEAEISKGRLRAFLPTEVEQIFEDGIALRDTSGKQAVFPNNAVVVQVGGTAPTALLRDIGIELVTKYGEA
ncbi:MAG: hypothetical protein OEV36_09160, partial [Myxococcales bacterium]|nr:hypothetical protein [Myxococcales bacterium]